MGLGHRRQDAVPVLHGGRGPRRQRALLDREVGIGDDELGIHLEPRPQPVARGARPVGRVEREVARVQLVEGHPAVRAGEVLRERLELLVALVGRHGDRGDPLGQLEGRLDAVGDSAADALLGHQAVDHDLDRVLEVLGQPDRLGEIAHLPVDPGPREPLAGQVFQELAVLTLASADDGREHLEPRALRQREHLVDDLLGGLAADRPPAVVAMGSSDPRVQDAQVVVDLGDRPDGRSAGSWTWTSGRSRSRGSGPR